MNHTAEFLFLAVSWRGQGPSWCDGRIDVGLATLKNVHCEPLIRNICQWSDGWHSIQSILSDTFNSVPDNSMNFCFLGRDRSLIASYSLTSYSIEGTIFQAAWLLTCFFLPVSPMMKIKFIFPMDDIHHISQPHTQAQQAMWTLDPHHQLISILTVYPHLVFIISLRP